MKERIPSSISEKVKTTIGEKQIVTNGLGYSSERKSSGLKFGIGGVHAGMILHLGGILSSISKAFSFNFVSLGSIFMACCFIRILQFKS